VNLATGQDPRPLDQLADAGALTGAEIVGLEAAGLAACQRRDVSSCQVGHVDIVMNAGPVRRVVVGTEDGDIGPDSVRGLKDQWDDVRFRIVLLAQLTFGIGAPGIEIAQRDGTQAVRGTSVAQLLENTREPTSYFRMTSISVIAPSILPASRGPNVSAVSL